MSNKNRFFLAQDDDCHWYLIQAEFREEWEAWEKNNYDSDLPPCAREINGPHKLTFIDPREE